jgi:Tat protein secretion system quality control protein TatD with DNase activity
VYQTTSQNRVFAVTSLRSARLSRLGYDNEIIVDYFEGVVHCYNQTYAEARQIIDKFVDAFLAKEGQGE